MPLMRLIAEGVGPFAIAAILVLSFDRHQSMGRSPIFWPRVAAFRALSSVERTKVVPDRTVGEGGRKKDV
jgi:hypothetical protein